MCKPHTFLAPDSEFEVMPISKSSKINGLLKRIFLFFKFSLKRISSVNSSPILWGMNVVYGDISVFKKAKNIIVYVIKKYFGL